MSFFVALQWSILRLLWYCSNTRTTYAILGLVLTWVYIRLPTIGAYNDSLSRLFSRHRFKHNRSPFTIGATLGEQSFIRVRRILNYFHSTSHTILFKFDGVFLYEEQVCGPSKIEGYIYPMFYQQWLSVCYCYRTLMAIECQLITKVLSLQMLMTIDAFQLYRINGNRRPNICPE